MLPCLLFAEPGFERSFGGPADEYSHSCVSLADGYLLAGWTNSFGAGYSDRYLVRTDERGDTLWTRTYGTRYGAEIGFKVEPAEDGGFVVCGYTIEQNRADVTLMKTDAQGNLLWDRRYGGSSDDMAHAVDVTYDSGFVIAGCTYSYGTGVPNIYVVRTDAQGETLWTRVFGGSGEDYAFAVAACRDSGFIVCGWSTSFGSGGSDIYLIKTDARGNAEWTRTYGGPQNEACHSVVQLPGGGYVLGAQTLSYGAGQADFYFLRLDEQGETLWTRTYGGAGSDLGHRIDLCRDGGFILTGQTSSFGAGSYDAWLVKVDSSGDTSWTRTFGGPSDDRAYGVQQHSDGGYLMTGVTSSIGAGMFDCWLIKTDSLGRVAVAEPGEPAGFRGSCSRSTIRPVADARASGSVVLFDASGRRLQGITRAGVYYRADSGRSFGRVVVVK